MNRELQEIRKRGRLPANSYIIYSVEDGGDPFVAFKDKYGFEPTQAILSKSLKLNIPDGIEIVAANAPTGHIYLR